MVMVFIIRLSEKAKRIVDFNMWKVFEYLLPALTLSRCFIVTPFVLVCDKTGCKNL